MRRRNREVLLAVFSGAAMAILSIQLHMIHTKRGEIKQIVDQQRVLLNQLTRFQQDIKRYIGRQ